KEGGFTPFFNLLNFLISQDEMALGNLIQSPVKKLTMKKLLYFLLFTIGIHSHLFAQKNTIIQGKIWAVPNDTITIATYAINYSFKIPGNEQYKL
ncbi:hypothetical protein ABTH35_19820, partial [Acinetobacter baumannii]